MRRDIVLAIAVLSVLAGLVAVGYAQNTTEDQPDAVELRRMLLDRIESAYGADDTDTLAKLAAVQAKIEENEEWLDTYARNRVPEVQYDSDNPDGLQRVESAFGFDIGAFGLCVIAESFDGIQCGSSHAYCMQGTTVGGDPDSASLELELEVAVLRCDLEYEYCMNGVQDRANLCKTLAVLVPG